MQVALVECRPVASAHWPVSSNETFAQIVLRSLSNNYSLNIFKILIHRILSFIASHHIWWLTSDGICQCPRKAAEKPLAELPARHSSNERSSMSSTMNSAKTWKASLHNWQRASSASSMLRLSHNLEYGWSLQFRPRNAWRDFEQDKKTVHLIEQAKFLFGFNRLAYPARLQLPSSMLLKIMEKNGEHYGRRTVRWLRSLWYIRLHNICDMSTERKADDTWSQRSTILYLIVWAL